MMQTDVKSTRLDVSGVIYAGPTRIKGYQVTPGGTAGEIIFNDNASAASGAVPLQFKVTTNTVPFGFTLPGEGTKCNNGIYVTLPTATHITVFYG
jgi:hypothetical protein